MISFVAVVLTYNRPHLLKENIEAVLNQDYLPAELIVVDNNSTDNTEELVKGYLNNNKLRITYKKLDRNYGSAGGFYYAIKEAYDLGYEYILTMDDDGKPFYPNSFRMLINGLEIVLKETKSAIVGPLVTYDGLNTSFGPNYSNEYIKNNLLEKKPIFENFISPYNGTIITRQCIESIGFPNKDFYLYGDEIDYTFRAEENGIKLLTVINSIYQHPKPADKVHKFFSKNVVSYEGTSDRKQYYYIRNHYYALKTHNRRKLARNLILNRIVSILFYEKNKFHKFKILRMAIKDAKKNRIIEKQGL